MEFGESLVLVLDTRSNMTSKYGSNFFIIIRHYKSADCEIQDVKLGGETDPAIR